MHVARLSSWPCTEVWFWESVAYVVSCRGRQPLRWGECNTPAQYTIVVEVVGPCGPIVVVVGEFSTTLEV